MWMAKPEHQQFIYCFLFSPSALRLKCISSAYIMWYKMFFECWNICFNYILWIFVRMIFIWNKNWQIISLNFGKNLVFTLFFPLSSPLSIFHIGIPLLLFLPCLTCALSPSVPHSSVFPPLVHWGLEESESGGILLLLPLCVQTSVYSDNRDWRRTARLPCAVRGGFIKSESHEAKLVPSLSRIKYLQQQLLCIVQIK